MKTVELLHRYVILLGITLWSVLFGNLAAMAGPDPLTKQFEDSKIRVVVVPIPATDAPAWAVQYPTRFTAAVCLGGPLARIDRRENDRNHNKATPTVQNCEPAGRLGQFWFLTTGRRISF